MGDVQTQLPVKVTDGTHTVAITSSSALQVDGSGVTQPVSFGDVNTGVVCYYNTSTAVANGSTGTITYSVTAGKTLYLKGIIASSSGAPCKVVVDYGTIPTVATVGFYSAASPTLQLIFQQPINIAATTAVNVKITNNAGAAQDVYATIMGHES